MGSRAKRDLSPRHPRETEITSRGDRSRGLLSRFPEGGGSDNSRIARESRVITHLIVISRFSRYGVGHKQRTPFLTSFYKYLLCFIRQLLL